MFEKHVKELSKENLQSYMYNKTAGHTQECITQTIYMA